ncbi:uncharacterized protein F4807DRAFT_463430 [Annulohypoxylon truncatum]|uniref:uncharacterized protein n=1 Tax=Annulohypoxylon truncatum TaxID=327061 RepID=UPI002007C769|nr:uncharacterized protein F4807DRAFT_463430 [Annulohypoxylon truncatum]KAI1206741.1 hypothetical protein F4807DRAFT_463430 [Annulohypoxylon truncatum]
MGLAKATAAVYLLAFSALGGAEVTTTSAGTGTGTSTKAAHSITTNTTTTSRTVTHTSATSPAGKTSTSPSHVPGVTHIPDSPILLSIVPLLNPQSRERDSSNGSWNPESLFVTTSTPFLTRSCANASPFNLISGRLSNANDGAHLSTIPDVVYQPLTTTTFAHANPGRAIDETFSVEDGYLRWYDARFYGGRARYCVSGEKEMVNVVFHINKTWPEGCEEVDVRVFRENECREGKVVEGVRIGGVEEVETGRMGGQARTTGTSVAAGVDASATTAPGGSDEL